MHYLFSRKQVQDAAYVGNRAFSPNPINIKVEDTITWTNDDIETHTVTSGLGFDSEFGKKFISGIMGYKRLFPINSCNA